MREIETPRIYVACLAAYNGGTLHGCWIDAAQDVEDIWREIRQMLASSPEAGAEEWAIHDYEGFGPLRLIEFEGIENVHKLARFIDEHGEIGAALLAALELINVDKDGDGFICREAMGQVRDAIAKAKGKTA